MDDSRPGPVDRPERAMGDAAACRYCGLPVTALAQRADPSTSVYCCVGCRLAESVTGAVGEQGQVNATLVRAVLAGFLSMNVMMFSMVLWSQDLSDADASDRQLALLLWSLYRAVCLLFATPAILLLLGPLVSDCWQRAKQGVYGTDLLLVSGVLAAYAYSCISVIRNEGDVYFEVACMILVAVTLGRWLEARGRRQATDAIHSLDRLLPPAAVVVRNGREEIIESRLVGRDEVVRIRPGAAVPVDGVLLGPACEADERILTGESLPVTKRPGDLIHAGCVTLATAIEVRTVAAGAETAIARMAEFVRRACEEKGWRQRIADRLSACFLPVVGLLAIVAFVGPALENRIAAGILQSLSVLVAACPCALGLATPMAIWAALGNAAFHQILFRSGAALERLASIGAVCFDKTGTLTEGHRVVAAACWPESDRDRLLSRAADLARHSSHPIAAAVAAHGAGLADDAMDRTAPADEAMQFTESPGLGISAVGAAGELACLGSESFLRQREMEWASEELRNEYASAVASGAVVACFGLNGTIRSVFQFEERLRNDAIETIQRLGELNLKVWVLTGDHPERARRLTRQLGVPVLGGLSPEAKVSELTQIARLAGSVAMAGDGVNDAPALASADVGIALERGADVSRLAADVCLLGDSLTSIPDAIRMARLTVRIIHENLFWAFSYNLVVLALATSGRLNPVQASIAMVVSSLLVSMNSLRLRGAALFSARWTRRRIDPAVVDANAADASRLAVSTIAAGI